LKDIFFNLAFEKKSIKFRRPAGDDWFNILVIHQTKERGTTASNNLRSFVKESILPGFIDLVLWGHEHECIPNVKKCEATGINILYMGSTTITSLIEAESKPKHCFILNITRKDFSLIPIQLKNARPLLYGNLELSKCNIQKNGTIEYIDSQIQQAIITKITEMLKNADVSQIPLLRLKVEYSGFSVIRTEKIGLLLKGKIANCVKDFIKFYKRPATCKKPQPGSINQINQNEIIEPENLIKTELDSIVFSR